MVKFTDGFSQMKRQTLLPYILAKKYIKITFAPKLCLYIILTNKYLNVNINNLIKRIKLCLKNMEIL
jgi:hypothetical protein